NDLPPGSVVQFKIPSLWEENKKYVIGALTLILVQSGLLGWLSLERRKRLQNEEARLQLAAIVESSRDAIIGLSLGGEILSWNRGAELMYGYSEREILGRHISIIAPPERIEALYQGLRKLAAGELIENYETVRLKKDGSRLDVSVSVSYIKDAKGRTVAAASIGRDISERKRSEAALRESEARFRNMADTAPVLVWMSGSDGLCTYFNRGWLEFTGRTMEQEFASGWAEGVHEADYERCLKTY